MTGLGEARMLVGGELVGAASGATFDNLNPATEQVIGVTADASAEDMEGAVAAAENGVEGFEEYLEVKTVGLPARG